MSEGHYVGYFCGKDNSAHTARTDGPIQVGPNIDEVCPYAILILMNESVNYNPHITRGEHTSYYGSTTTTIVRKAPM